MAYLPRFNETLTHFLRTTPYVGKTSKTDSPQGAEGLTFTFSRYQLGLLLAVVFLLSPICRASDSPQGTVKGRVVDASTMQPIIGASVGLVGTTAGASTDEEGHYRIQKVPVGTYAVSFRSLGYEPLTITDIVVKPGRIVFVNAELRQSTVAVDSIVVSAGFFAQPEDAPSSSVSFSGEEIRRSPGTAGDVSRILAGLPSIAKVDDQMNALAVRGGSPLENAFYLDNIEIPNINHYPLQGTTSGPIGLLNVDFIKSVDFSAGGFPAAYGGRLSSVMELTFREGNREEFDGQIGAHFAGLEATVEGPMAGRRGSWMFSARRSYLDLLVDAIGTGVAPKYSDYQGKAVYDLSSRSQLTVLGVAGVDYIEFEKDQSIEDGFSVYGISDGWEYAFGTNWRYLWKSGFSNTSLGYLATKYGNSFYETKSDLHLTEQNTTEAALQVRNRNHYRSSESLSLDFGFDLKQVFNDYYNRISEYTNFVGDTTAPDTVDIYEKAVFAGGYVSATWRPVSRLTTTFGLRYDWSEANHNHYVSPRFSFSWEFSNRTALTGATGVYRQFLQPSILVWSDSFRQLRDPMAVHYVLGARHLLRSDTRLTVEVFYKEYYHMPMDPDQPQLMLADEYGFARLYAPVKTLVDNGRAYSAGVELTLQRKLVSGLYGLVSGSYSRSRYEGYDGVWRNRLVDNKVLVSVEGGYKPNERWDYSLRWVFAGGRPYTPLDEEASAAINRSVRDETLVNGERFPAYHSLNLRVDRRFNWSGSNLIVYLSVWNAYNRENVSDYYWNEIEQKQDVIHQWSMLPIVGMEYEF
jgi:hypothetical protein